MTILLKRIAPRDTYTIGKLYIDGQYICDTCEDKVRDLSKEKKVYGETAIPYGTYKVSWTYSPKFKKYMPLIEDVPQFNGVRIHSGNTAKDSLGCILVGENKQKGMVLNSRATVNKLYPIIKKGCLSKEGCKIIIQ